MTEADLNWLAGLLEGEACFSVARVQHGSGNRGVRAYMRVHMIDRDVIDRVAMLLGGRSVWSPNPPAHRGRTRTWAVQVAGEAAQDLMVLLYPLLGTRRKAQIDRVLRECDPDGLRYKKEGT